MALNSEFVQMLRGYKPKGTGVSLGYPHLSGQLPSDELFKSLDIKKMDVFDIKAFIGMEIIINLNLPIPLEYIGKYDFLINPGTYEHCFNVAQAMMNGYNLVKPGGLSFHTAPIARGRHGFWNMNRDTFIDFYKANGGAVIHQKIMGRSMYVVARNGPEPRRAVLVYERR